MSYRVELERFGAVVTVETVAEVKELLEAMYPIQRLEITGGPGLDAAILADLGQGVARLHPGRDVRVTPAPPTPKTKGKTRKVRDRTTVTIDPQVERGLIALVKDDPRSGAELARVSGIGQTTVARYMRSLELAGKVHLEGAGRAAKWALGPKEEP